MKIKVLQLVEGFNFGGAETKLLELVEHMDKSRFETTVVGLGLGNEIEDRFMALDCSVKTFKRKHRFDFSLMNRLEKFIRNEQIDIVMTTLFYADVMGAMVGHKGGAKGVFAWETISSPKWLTPHRLFGYRYAIRRADKVISVSNATAEWLVTRRKVPRDKVMIIPYGVNLEIFKPNTNDAMRKELHIEPNHVVIGQVSRLNEQKGHQYLIDAAPQIISQNKNVRFVLVGDGPLQHNIKQQIRDKGLVEYFELLGFRRDVPELLRTFDIFTLPSLYEGLPNVVLEAMASGLPVVATPVDGTKEAVVHNKTGLLVPEKEPGPLADALIKLVQDPQLAEKMGLAGRKRVEEKFSLNVQVSRFEELYIKYATQRQRIL